ncbi:MAG: Pr6Pr family membrane protein [Bacilli bacterium]|nr:Pr6Pr family membrane protein [Bacilli bacterium]
MKNKFRVTIFMLAVLGISLTLFDYMFLSGASHPLLEGIYTFRYFTIQSNFIVALYFGMSCSDKWSNHQKFESMLGGVAIYITITFLVFMTILDPIYDPQGLNLIGSTFSHYIVPILVIIYMVVYRDEIHFEKKDILYWISYPVCYLIFLITYGILTGDYLYPFFQVNEVGIIGLIVVTIMMVLFFLLVSFLLVKILSKKENAK